MSNALAIATVTEALAHVVTGGLDGANVSGALVTTLPPDSPSGLPASGVNVYLYQVSPNAALRNADLPTRDADGTLLRRPQAAIDLHYLLTFYGDETQLEQQRLLGAVARVLHAQPVIPRSTIQYVQGLYKFLSGADLDAQPDLVRVTPINFSLEELSKLWSFLLKIDYVLSVAYAASVVLIETDDPVPPPALPVLATNIYALPFAPPIVTDIASVDGPNAPVVDGVDLIVTGRNFVGTPPSTTQVLIGGVTETPLTLGATQLTAPLPFGLAAGPQPLQIVQSLLLGTPPVSHDQGFESGVATFVLHPVIRQSSPGVYEITVMPGMFFSPPGAGVTVKLDPIVQAGQRALLELIDMAQPVAAHLFDGGTVAAATDTVTFDVSGLFGGTYLVRVLIDGAQSPVELDPSGVPIAPLISL